jgi:cellulose synthase operon protein YhjQ
MNILAIYGIKGGSGATSMVAALSLLWRQQKPVLAIDLCQQNLLRLHFGLAPDEHDGWCSRLLAGEDWTQAAWQAGERLHLVPYGRASAWARCPQLDRSDWLKSELSALALPHSTQVLLDLPDGAVRARRQGLNAASHVLVVLPADAATCVLLDQLEEELADCGVDPRHTYFVLGQFDPVRRLDRDVEVLLRKRLGERLAPLPVQRDASVREALASRQSLFAYAPECQAADDLRQLAVWLSVRMPEVDGA